MKVYSLFYLFVLLPTITYSQIELKIKEKNLNYFIQQEQSNHGTLQKNKYNHVLSDDIAQPLQYKRKETNLPDLIVEYFYYKSDSTLDHILYEWDDNNFKTFEEQKKPKSIEEMQHFVNKYNELFSFISKEYGQAKSEGEISNINNTKNNPISKKDIWLTNDSIEINLYIFLSSKFEKKGMVITVPTYKIRLYIRNPDRQIVKKNITPAKADTKELDIIFKGFLVELKQLNYENLKTYLSPSIASSVTQKQLEDLSQNIKDNSELELFYSGIQLNQKMEPCNFIQYKYSTDKKSPPTEVINVVFDVNNRILSIQPLKR